MTQDGRERLSAPQRGTPWTLGEGWIEATCGEDHPAPAADCGCGIHAWHPRPASARRILRSRFDLPGIVEADGAVEVHEDGFRAQRARPYAFVRMPGRNPFLIERLAAAYGAEVLDLRRAEELLAVCRERGLGLREPVVEELIGAERDRRAPPRPRAPAAQRRPAGRRCAAGRRGGVRAGAGTVLGRPPAEAERPSGRRLDSEEGCGPAREPPVPASQDRDRGRGQDAADELVTRLRRA